MLIIFGDADCEIIEALHFFLYFIQEGSGPNLINQGSVWCQTKKGSFFGRKCTKNFTNAH